MNNEEFITKLIRLAQEFEQDSRYLELHNFTYDTGKMTDFVLSSSSASYKRASDKLYALIAEYLAGQNQNTYKGRINYYIKRYNSRVLSLETSSSKTR